MRPFTIAELSRLAEVYCAHASIALSGLSRRVFPKPVNDQAFVRLANGESISAKNAEKASVWFAENWPDDLPWPEDVPPARERAA